TSLTYDGPAVLTIPCRPRVATATRGRLALSASVRHTDAFSDGASIAHFSGAKLPRRRALGQNSSADPPRSAATPFSQPPLVIRLSNFVPRTPCALLASAVNTFSQGVCHVRQCQAVR